MAYEQAYVFALGPDEQHYLVGKLQSTAGAGHFQYSPLWLEQPWAYPLDPHNLPLSAKRYRAVNTHGLYGVFRDAAPDDWGTRIMLLRNQHAPANELERLIRTSGGGVGCLRYSLARERAKIPEPLPQMSRLLELADIAERLDAKQSLAPEELALLEPGSSMGGARPKVSVSDEDGTWLVKFSKVGDMVDVPLLEYCSMQFLAQHLGLNVPTSRLIAMGQKHAFAIKRFDHHCHFISANSLFNQDRVRQIKDSARNPYSYCNLASLIRKYCEDFKSDTEELFKRMLANILMGNTDDHARNHALLFDISKGCWQLSPAYDMLPTVASSSPLQAMGVGKEGAKASVDNALSYARLFGLAQDQALAISQELQDLYRNVWPNYCKQMGLLEPDQVLINRVNRALN